MMHNPEMLKSDDFTPEGVVDVAIIMADIALEGAEHGVILHLIDHVIQICVSQVDAADLVGTGASLQHNAQCHTADTAKTVDTNANRCHIFSPFPSTICL
jgi:hypothetical protein